MSRAAAVALLALTLAPPSARAERQISDLLTGGRPPATFFDVGPLRLTIAGQTQLQAAIFTGEDARLFQGDAAEKEGFRLSRARFGTAARYVPKTDFEQVFEVALEVDLLEPEGTALHEAWVGHESPWHLAYAGLVKVPFSRTALFSSEDLQLITRPLSTVGMAPFQQFGILLGGKVWDERVRLTAGLANGLERGNTFWAGYQRRDPTNGNRFGGFTLSGRLDVEPLGKLTPGPADLEHVEDPLLGVGGGVLWDDGETTEALAYGADLQFKWMGLSLTAEYLQDSSEPADQPSAPTPDIGKVERRTITAQLGYSPLVKTLDVAFRFELIDDNLDIDDEGDQAVYAAAVSYYAFDGRFKAQAQYQHREELHGLDLENDVALVQVEGRF